MRICWLSICFYLSIFPVPWFTFRKSKISRKSKEAKTTVFSRHRTRRRVRKVFGLLATALFDSTESVPTYSSFPLFPVSFSFLLHVVSHPRLPSSTRRSTALFVFAWLTAPRKWSSLMTQLLSELSRTKLVRRSASSQLRSFRFVNSPPLACPKLVCDIIPLHLLKFKRLG